MEGILHIILGTPESGRRSNLSAANIEEEQPERVHFLLPDELSSSELPYSTWTWKKPGFHFKSTQIETAETFFLFFSNKLDLADQFEATLDLLAFNEKLRIGRVVLFINSSLLAKANEPTNVWVESAGHFADAICFTNRENANAKAISKCKESFANMRYPLETYLLGSKKVPPLERILALTPRRISHIFDPPDLLDSEDSPQNDPFLAKMANGRRERPIPLPFLSPS